MTALIEASMDEDNKSMIDLSGKFHTVSKAQNPKIKLKDKTCLHIAASTGHVPAVYALLSTGIFDVNEEANGKSLGDFVNKSHNELLNWLFCHYGVGAKRYRQHIL